MFYELRQYGIKNGQIDNWVRLMEDEIIPFQQSKGMVIVGSFKVENSSDTYFWMRRFASEEERVAQYDAVYKSDHWLNVIKPKIDTMLNREAMVITRLVPTAKSVIS